MPLKIEDYALIGDLHTAALVGRDGSIDWLCMPRFDSGACFAALLGSPENGRWRIGPAGEARSSRRYRDGTLILETDFETAEGAVRLIDFMRPREERPHVVRIVEGVRGQVPMRLELVIRFDYGQIVPWVRRTDLGLSAVAGPDALDLVSTVEHRGEDFTHRAEFAVEAGQRLPFVLWPGAPRTSPPGRPGRGRRPSRCTEERWRAWSSRGRYRGDYADAVGRSLITLKALTYRPTGGVVAAPTTSLPEALGGVRNWDYRYCWLRDATFTLLSLLDAGYHDVAIAWREWLMRAVAGKPSQLQIMYGLGGERRLTEYSIDWLAGFEGSRPVRVGNAASEQFQLDVYGEVIDVMHQCRREGLGDGPESWRVESAIVEHLESAWKEADEGIWEVRGPRRHFTHSKVMAWVAFDRAVKAVKASGLEGPIDRWRAARDAAHRQVCEQGFDAARNTFVQSYGSTALDASLLMIPLVGFLPAHDPRVLGTVAAIEKGLTRDGFVLRYDPRESVDGLPPGEGVFLMCTFWLADNYALQGRLDEARTLFERLLSRSGTTWAFSPRSTTRARSGCSGTSRRHSRTSRWSTRPATSAARTVGTSPEGGQGGLGGATAEPSFLGSPPARGCLGLRLPGLVFLLRDLAASA